MKKTYHAWYTRTPEDAKREVRATWQPPHWYMMAKVEGEEEWTKLQPPPLDDVRELHDRISAKYARRRATHDEMVGADKALEEAATRDREAGERLFTDLDIHKVLARVAAQVSSGWDTKYVAPEQPGDAHHVEFENNDLLGDFRVWPNGTMDWSGVAVQTGEQTVTGTMVITTVAEMYMKAVDLIDSLLE